MTLNLQDLSIELSNLIKNTDFKAVRDEINSSTKKLKASQFSILNSSNQTISGFKGLINVTDFSTELSNNINIASMTKNVPDLQQYLIGNVPSSHETDLKAITETDSDAVDGFLYDAKVASSPESISALLQTVTNLTPDKYSNVLENLTDKNISSYVIPAITNNYVSSLTSSLSQYTSVLYDKIEAKDQLIVYFANKISNNFEKQLVSIGAKNIPKSVVKQMLQYFLNDKKDESYELLKPYIEEDLEEEFKAIDISVSSIFNIDTSSGTNSLEVKEIGELPENRSVYNTGESSNGKTWSFEIIRSNEELESLFRNVSRSKGNEITGATIHWSNTFLDQNIDAKWLNDQGDIDYHILIRRDGSLQLGRSLLDEGNHDKNHNKNFLGFCFIGGYNEMSYNAIKPYDQYSSSKSFTAQQWNSFDSLIRIFIEVFPHSQIIGHYMSDKTKVDPGFDVPEYIKTKFKRTNIYDENSEMWQLKDAISEEMIKGYVESDY